MHLVFRTNFNLFKSVNRHQSIANEGIENTAIISCHRHALSLEASWFCKVFDLILSWCPAHQRGKEMRYLDKNLFILFGLSKIYLILFFYILLRSHKSSTMYLSGVVTATFQYSRCRIQSDTVRQVIKILMQGETENMECKSYAPLECTKW